MVYHVTSLTSITKISNLRPHNVRALAEIFFLLIPMLNKGLSLLRSNMIRGLVSFDPLLRCSLNLARACLSQLLTFITRALTYRAVRRVDVALIDVRCGKGLARACFSAKVDKGRDFSCCCTFSVFQNF